MNAEPREGGDWLTRALAFMAHLDGHRVPYTLSHARPDALMVSARTPLALWEVEFFAAEWPHAVEVERLGAGFVQSEDELAAMYQELEIDRPA